MKKLEDLLDYCQKYKSYQISSKSYCEERKEQYKCNLLSVLAYIQNHPTKNQVKVMFQKQIKEN